MGPNVRKLIARKVAVDAIPAGGGFAAGLEFLSDPKRILKATREATDWVNRAIAAVKNARDNPHGTDDEAIAGSILAQLAERDKLTRSEWRAAQDTLAEKLEQITEATDG